MRIALTPHEFVDIGSHGLRRLSSALEKKRTGAHGWHRNPQDRYRIDVEGIHAEYVVARALGLPFAPATDRLDSADGDLPGGIQVRSTKYANGSLLVHDSDDDEHRFVLVTGELGIFDIRGWIYGHEGKKDEYVKTYKGRTAYWVPQSALRPLDTLEVSA